MSVSNGAQRAPRRSISRPVVGSITLLALLVLRSTLADPMMVVVTATSSPTLMLVEVVSGGTAVSGAWTLNAGTNTIVGTYNTGVVSANAGGKNVMVIACFAPGTSIPPTVYNAPGATNVLAVTADLKGTLISTGTAPTQVWVYWGTNNAGQTKTWAFTNDFGGAYQTTGGTGDEGFHGAPFRPWPWPRAGRPR